MSNIAHFREIEVDVIADGTVSVAFSTDLPGSEVAVRHTGTINTTTGRRKVRIRVPGSSKGYLYKLRFTTTSVGRIYSVLVHYRSLGANVPWSRKSAPIPPVPVARQWVEIPVDAVA